MNIFFRSCLRICGLFLLLFITLLLQACDNPFSIALHNPISPAPGDQVTYSLEMSGSAPKEVKLYERISTLTAINIPFIGQFIVTTPGPEVLLQTWTNPSAGTISFSKRSGTPASSMITYRFEILQSNNQTFRHEVSYCSRDYPIANKPIPVYVTGSITNTFDIVFIPDNDITNLNTFRDHCRRNIREAFFDENTTKIFRHSFNFYINRQTGHATDYDRIPIDGQHQTPSNYAQLSFAEGKVILHQNNLRDYTLGDGLYSTEMQNRGTILHESGHGLFGLADEYDGGAHWQASTFPNNWSSLAGAQNDASGRGKNSSDALQIGSSSWFKLCNGNCQMLNTGLTHTSYDRPCVDKVIYQIVEISSQ